MSTKGGSNSDGALEPKRAVLVRPFPIKVIEHAGHDDRSRGEPFCPKSRTLSIRRGSAPCQESDLKGERQTSDE